MSLAGVDVGLSGFNPTTYAVDGGSPGAAPVIDAIGLSSVLSCPPTACTVPATRSTSLWRKSGFGIDKTSLMYYTRTYGDGYDA